MNHNLCFVSSQNKNDESISNSDFKVNFGNMTCIEAINKVVIKQIMIPNVFYNIDEKGYNINNDGNNRFTYSIGAVKNTITIPVGNYTITSLITALESDPTLAGLGMSITLNPLTNKLEFTTTTPIQYLDEKNGNRMARVLGIDNLTFGDVNNFTAQGFNNLSGIQQVFFQSQKISDGSNLVVPNGRCKPIFATIPITVGFGSYQHYITPHPEIDDVEYPSLRNGTTLREIDIQIVDRFDNILDLGGLDVIIILKIYHNTP